MPSILNLSEDDIQSGIGIGSTNFKFSAMKVEKLADISSEFTIVTVALDISGSIHMYETELKSALQTIIKSTKSNARSENIIIRVIKFNDKVEEEIGFVPVSTIDENNLNNLNATGLTALYDAVINSIGALEEYSKKLTDCNFIVNGLVIIITDGEDNASTYKTNICKQTIQDIIIKEKLESLQTILIGLNAQHCGRYLNNFKTEVGIDHYIEFNDLNIKDFAKLARFISESISSSSKALGTGGPSQLVSLDLN